MQGQPGECVDMGMKQRWVEGEASVGEERDSQEETHGAESEGNASCRA